MKKKSIVLLLGLICAIAVLPIAVEKILDKNSSSFVKEEYSYQTFQIDKDKWGYTISHFEKPFIKQNYIPAIGGKVCFSSEEDAGNTAKFVLAKLKKKEIPSLTIEELKQLGVIHE